MNTFEDLYKQLNDQQREAVDRIDGPVTVLAGPGTGKTQLLSVRTANILRKTDLYPSNILILTFTNAGVKAMRERLARLIGPDGYDVVVETFHGFANNLISDSEEASSVKSDRVEMTKLEQLALLEHLLDNLEGIRDIRNPNVPYLYRGDIESNVSALKRDGIRPQDLHDFLKDYQADGEVIEVKHVKRLKAFAEIYEAYEDSKNPDCKHGVFDIRGRYDFDDMILLAIETLQKEPELLARYREQFQYVMVDEFQDTNGSQLKLMRTLFPDAQSNICVVGDDDQSIYRFQGASAGNFHLFEKLYTDPQQIRLEQNYRSVAEILQVSSQIIDQIPLDERVAEKHLQPARGNGEQSSVQSHRFGTVEEELTYLVQQLEEMDVKQLNNTAVLVRTRRQAQDVIEAFLQAGIGYTTDGKEDIRGEFRVQQVLKILRFAQGDLDFEQKDLLLFEVLLSDFWQISGEDLVSFTRHVGQKKTQYREQRKRKTNKTPKQYQQEEAHVGLLIPDEGEDQHLIPGQPSLFSELFQRFPLPERPPISDHEAPTEEETQQLSICQEMEFKKPTNLHKASWALQRLSQRSAHYPVYSLIMEFLQDAGMVDFILSHYHDQEVVKLRELRSISSFVENLKKASQADPGVMVNKYIDDLQRLEAHGIALTGEMVSSAQQGVKVLTAHGSKGLEFDTVFIPFCLQDKAWPKRKMTSKIPLPHKLMIGQEIIAEKQEEKKLHQYDENRLFYVAATRAQNRLIFSAAPTDKQVFSQFLTNIDLSPEQRTEIPEEVTLIQLLSHRPNPDPLAQTHRSLKGLAEDIVLSPSSVNTYLGCHRKFLYHNLLRAPQPKNQALVYGQCVHKGLEKAYRRYMKEGQMPPLKYFEEQFLQELDWQGIDQSIRQGCLHKLEDAKLWYQQLLINGTVKPLELERKITRRLKNGVVFTGQFDKVDPAGTSGEVNVIDYKTGQPDKHIKAIQNCRDIKSEDCDDYLRQLVAYKVLYEGGHQSRKVSKGTLVFVDPVKATVKKYDLEEGSYRNQDVELTKEMVNQYEELLGEVWNSIQEMDFSRLEEYDKKKCDFCPYSGVCWQ